MPKYRAEYTVTLRCEVNFDAPDLNAAQAKADEYDMPDLLDFVEDEEIELDEVYVVRARS